MKGSRLEQELEKAGSEWRDEDLAEILALLEEDHTKPREQGQMQPLEEQPLEEQPQEPQLQEPQETMPLLVMEEYVPTEPHRAGTGEQPDFGDAPVAPKKEWAVIPLGILAVAEIAALVAIVMWWQQWII